MILNENRGRLLHILLYSQSMEEIAKILRKEIEEGEEEYLLISSDYAVVMNARTRNEGGLIGDRRRKTKKSKDKIINKEGRIMIKMIKDRG